ncbi:hypothetical protein FACS1894103_6110 [Campylobacterota bacterium]|nr:hypothetical protein FACS1894103_6110 [Campylobacterota bacterium]
MPYGCKFFGFKCRYMPDQTVFGSSGAHCTQFIDKTAKDDQPTDPDDQPNGRRGFVA